jgi:glucose-1-phosphate thymidylyltransferase
MENHNEFLNEIISLKKNLEKDLPVLIKGNKKIKKGVYLGKNVKLEPNVFFDASKGLILIGEGTKIKANTILRGPLLIGKNCVVNSFAEISFSKIGDVCKIGGEIEHVIIKSYSNKQHHGFLGDSYIGSWVNIGAGTSISNLKNTYTNIKLNGVDTGIQFLGCIMGDYVKTAINTSIFCGKIIGAGSHLYGTVTEDVPAFVSHIATGKLYELPLKVAEDIQKTMTRRRNVDWTKEDSKNFEKLFKQTESDRKKAKVKKSKLSFKL